MHVKDKIVPMFQRWARQKLRAMEGVRRWADGTTHEDGFSDISVSAFAREGGITGGAGVSNQHYDEVYTGDALTIWRIFASAPVEVVEITFAHYLATGDTNKKARALHISRTDYWKRLDNAIYYVAGRLDGPERAAGLTKSARPG